MQCVFVCLCVCVCVCVLCVCVCVLCVCVLCVYVCMHVTIVAQVMLTINEYYNSWLLSVCLKPGSQYDTGTSVAMRTSE